MTRRRPKEQAKSTGLAETNKGALAGPVRGKIDSLLAQDAFACRGQVVSSDRQVASGQTKGRPRERFDPGDGYRVRTVDAQEPVLRQCGGKSGQGLVDDVLSGDGVDADVVLDALHEEDVVVVEFYLFFVRADEQMVAAPFGPGGRFGEHERVFFRSGRMRSILDRVLSRRAGSTGLIR